MKQLFAVLLFALASHTVVAAEPVDDGKKMEGAWKPDTAEFGGEKVNSEELARITVTIKGNKYTTVAGDGKDEGTFQLYSAKKPKAMDITGTEGPNKGKTIPAIYELDGDTMRVCYALQGTNHPTEFKSTVENKYLLINYKRQKP
jgi:uncharacterized protein (TIGR03067 family)